MKNQIELRKELALDHIIEVAESMKIEKTRMPKAIYEARWNGASWQEIGDALGVTRQTAWEKYRSIATQVNADRRARLANRDEIQ